MKETSYFKKWVRSQVDRHYYITPSACVLLSFYVFPVEKPEGVTARLFDYLRAIAEKEIQIYKAQSK